MKTTEKYKELRIFSADNDTYSVSVDGVVKASGVAWDEIVDVVRALEESYDEPIQ